MNLRGDFWTPECIVGSLSRANVLKLNLDELPLVAQACGISNSSGANDVATLQALRRLFNLRLVALTRGSAGATLVALTEVDECPAPKTQVIDTVGAGDAYTAAMTLGAMKGWPLSTINQRAVAVSACVCSQPGAAPMLPNELKHWYVQP